MAVAADYMSKQVVALTPGDTLATARNVMLKRKIGRLVIVDENDRLVGILSRTDLALALRQGGPAWRRRPIDEILVGDVMKTQIAMAGPETHLSKVATTMLEGGIGGMPILKEGRIMGIITTHDITRYLAKKGDGSLKIRDHLDREVAVSSPLHSINHVIKLMISSPSKRVIVLDAEGLPIGIITPSNLAFVKFGVEKKFTYLRSQGGRYEPTHRRTTFLGIAQAVDVLSSPVYIAHEKDRVVDAAKTMVYHRVGGLPVLDAKAVLMGIFSKREVLKIVAEHMPT